MTTFSDDFNRADSTNLGAGWVEVSGDWSIISNQLSPGTTGTTILLRAATAMATSDNYAQVTIAATTAVTQGVWCRGDATLTSGYVIRNNGTSWDLFSVVSSTFTNIGTYSAAASAGDTVKVQAVGSTIKAFINGVERISVTNTAVATGTTVGIRSQANSTLRYDAFTSGDVGASVSGTATAAFGGLTAAASGTPTVTGAATASFGALTATASGTPKVTGTAALTGGALTATATGVRTVIGTATAQFGGLTATATAPSHITGTANATFGALTATARASGPAVVDQGSWYGLLDILREGAQLAREEQQSLPAACPDCGEPLQAGPNAENYCPFDGSIWGAGGRLAGHVSERR